MKLKKILILTLTFTFLISTTGIPVFYHYCYMMGSKSLNECEMCKLEVVEKEQTSCCSEIISESQLKLSDEKSSCCVDEFDYKKIEDNYSQIHQSLIQSCQVIISEIILNVDKTNNESKYSKKINFDLPPPKFGKKLLNSLNQLKIDLPVC